jgi:hypothetical protein
VAAGLDHDALFEQRGNLLGQRLGAAHVGDRHLRAAPAQKQRRRQPDFPSPTTRTFLPLSSIIFVLLTLRALFIVHRGAARARL